MLQRLISAAGEVRWSDHLRRLPNLVNPVTASPAAPNETVAALEALDPSLMPRTSKLQGVAMGLSVLGARATTAFVEKVTTVALPADAPLRTVLAARAAIAGAGVTLAAIPEREEEKLWVASVRSTGQLLRDGAAGGAVHYLARWLQQRYPRQATFMTTTVGVGSIIGLHYWAGRRLAAREAAVAEWPTSQKATLPGALVTGNVVVLAGLGLVRGFVWSRDAVESYFGPGQSKRLIARLANAGIWTGAAAMTYNAGVAFIGRTNEKLDAGYSTPPISPLVSGSPESLLLFPELGQQGRRFVTDVVTPKLIEEVMQEPAVAHPIRTYVGFNSEPLYQTGRAELALEELARTGGFDRSNLLLISPTGTGWVDQSMIEAAEFLTRGDIATCCIQYGRYPSFLALQKVALGRRQFRLLLWGVKQRLAERPPERRPRVLVFGESLGAWTSSDVIMFQGIDGFDHYGIDRALWVGMPWLAKWSRSGMTRGSSTLVPHGTVRVFDRHEQLALLDHEERARLRAVVLSHDNDPIAVLGPDLIVQRPPWLAHRHQGRGVPDAMRWRPMVTFVQTTIDAMNALLTAPPDRGSFGHDYRADMARFVRDTYRLYDTTEAQVARIEQVLETLGLERAERIKAGDAPRSRSVPAAGLGTDKIRAGVPLRTRRTPGPRWIRRRGSDPGKTVMLDALTGRAAGSAQLSPAAMTDSGIRE